MKIFLFCNGLQASNEGSFTLWESFIDILKILSFISDKEFDLWWVLNLLTVWVVGIRGFVTMFGIRTILSGGVLGNSVSFWRYLKLQNSKFFSLFVQNIKMQGQYKKELFKLCIFRYRLLILIINKKHIKLNKACSNFFYCQFLKNYISIIILPKSINI